MLLADKLDLQNKLKLNILQVCALPISARELAAAAGRHRVN